LCAASVERPRSRMLTIDNAKQPSPFVPQLLLSRSDLQRFPSAPTDPVDPTLWFHANPSATNSDLLRGPLASMSFLFSSNKPQPLVDFPL
jgi:hypothetical protein